VKIGVGINERGLLAQLFVAFVLVVILNGERSGEDVTMQACGVAQADNTTRSL